MLLYKPASSHGERVAEVDALQVHLRRSQISFAVSIILGKHKLITDSPQDDMAKRHKATAN